METITSTLDDLIENSLSDCKESLKSAFNITNFSSSGPKTTKGPGRLALTSSQGFRGKIWVKVEKAFGEEIYQHCKQIKFLQTTINTMNGQNIPSDIAKKFWGKLGQVIQDEIKRSPSAVQQMLEDDYPKLLKCFFDMFEKLKYQPYSFE